MLFQIIDTTLLVILVILEAFSVYKSHFKKKQTYRRKSNTFAKVIKLRQNE